MSAAFCWVVESIRAIARLISATSRSVPRGLGDHLDHRAHLLHTGRHLLQGAGGGVRRLPAFADVLQGAADQALDLVGRGGAALRQAAHFGGHHGEAASLVAGAGGFDGRIEREDVGLEGDALHRAQDRADLVRAAVDALHGASHGFHFRRGLGGDLRGGARQRLGLPAVFGVLAEGVGQVLDAGGSLLDGGGLFHGALRKVPCPSEMACAADAIASALARTCLTICARLPFIFMMAPQSRSASLLLESSPEAWRIATSSPEATRSASRMIREMPKIM